MTRLPARSDRTYTLQSSAYRTNACPRRSSSLSTSSNSTSELRHFLFGTSRSDLSRYREILADVQEGRCFYCNRRLNDSAAVDHFIPWRRYPLDLGHNFVLAHGSCNSSKSDRLAALPHLRRWHERNASGLYELECPDELCKPEGGCRPMDNAACVHNPCELWVCW